MRASERIDELEKRIEKLERLNKLASGVRLLEHQLEGARRAFTSAIFEEYPDAIPEILSEMVEAQKEGRIIPIVKA